MFKLFWHASTTKLLTRQSALDKILTEFYKKASQNSERILQQMVEGQKFPNILTPRNILIICHMIRTRSNQASYPMYLQIFKKVKLIVNKEMIDDWVYNGTHKIWTRDHYFMSLNNIHEAVKTLKPKNCESHERIPQRILNDGIEILKFLLSSLYNQIHSQKNSQAMTKCKDYTNFQ